MRTLSMYKIGRRAEHYVIGKLKKLGAALIIRSSRSLTPADLVAVFPKQRQIWFVQVKTSRRGTSLYLMPAYYPELKAIEGIYVVKGGFFVKEKGWRSKCGDTFHWKTDLNFDLGTLVGRLASLEHRQWVEWSKKLAEGESLSRERLDRWNKLWVDYSELSDSETESDRQWAREVLKVLGMGDET